MSSPAPASTPAAPRPAKPRRRWKWLRRLALGGGLLLGTAWFTRVSITNWALKKLPGFYDVKVTGVRPGLSGLTLTGVLITHRPTGMEMARAERVETAAGWGRMMDGDLETLRLVNAHVTWRDEFGDYHMPYVEGGPPAAPAVTWQQGEAEGGSFQWIERGQTVPRLSMDIVSLKGGKFTVYNDATSEATPQALVIRNLVSRELTATGRLTITSTVPHAEGSMSGQHKEHQFTIDGLQLRDPQVSMVWLEKVVPGSIPEHISCPPEPDWLKPVTFRIASATSAPGRVDMVVHQPGAAEPVELSAALRSLTAGDIRLAGGLPGIVGTVSATLADMKAPRAAAEWRELSLTGSLNDKKQFLVTSAKVNGAAIADSSKVLAALGFTPEEVKELPLCRGGADAKCVNLLLSEDGLTSTNPQEIVLRDFTALLPGEKEPVAALPNAEIVAVPDEALRDRRLRSVVADKPALKIDKTATAPVPGGASKVEAAAQAPAEQKPGWFGWNVDSLTAREGSLKATNMGSGVPNGFAKFDIHTAPDMPGGDSLYQIRVSDIKLANPLIPALPIPTGGVLDLDVHPLRFWQDGEVERAEFNGQEVELNSSFMNLFKPAPGGEKKEPSAAAPPEKKPKTTSWLPPLRVKKLVINNAKLSLDDIGDGRRLTVPITGQEFANVPLSPDLLEHDAAHTVQKIEVPAVYVYAPYDEGQTVVELPVNFIHFSFAGLAKKQLARVELVAPKIKAGRPLFDFVRRARTRFSEFSLKEDDSPPADDSSVPFVQKLLAMMKQTAEGKPAVWDIPFFTDTGIIITAPNGEEWTHIPRLPFRNARIKDGPNAGLAVPFRLYGDEVTGELSIDEGWYDFPAWKLRLHMSGEGKIVFNYPLADKSNNLVQVFKENTLIFQQLRIEKVWLSVTYDVEGIYASFGGETCGGYISGKVNLYLDQTYTWDASTSFTGIDMKPLTASLTREYVSLEGKVEQFDVTAHGDMTGLYQTSVAFKLPGSGRLRVHSLDALRRRLTEERVDWSDDAAKLGVELLRDFAFTSCEGSAKLYGREGNVRIKLAGPGATRDFNINLHDYRRRPEKSLIRF